MDPFPESLKERYEFLRSLGEGGGGRLFLVRENRTAQQQILKWVDQSENSEKRLALRQEFSVLQRLHHPHLPQVFAWAEAHDGVYFTREYIQGVALEEFFLKKNQLGILHLLLQQLIDTVDFLHQRGILHLDLKPANLLVGGTAQDLHLTLIDFGLARQTHFSAAQSQNAVGTPAFAAPEQFVAGATLDERTDLFAIGAVLRSLIPHLEPGQEDRKISLARIAERLTEAHPYRRFPSTDALRSALFDPIDHSRFPQPAPLKDSWEPAAFVGRDRERQEIEGFLSNLLNPERAVPARQAGFVLRGPKGIGRKRLLRELSYLNFAETIRWQEINDDWLSEQCNSLSMGQAAMQNLEPFWQRWRASISQPIVLTIRSWQATSPLIRRVVEFFCRAILTTPEAIPVAIIVVDDDAFPNNGILKSLELTPLSDPTALALLVKSAFPPRYKWDGKGEPDWQRLLQSSGGIPGAALRIARGESPLDGELKNDFSHLNATERLIVTIVAIAISPVATSCLSDTEQDALRKLSGSGWLRSEWHIGWQRFAPYSSSHRQQLLDAVDAHTYKEALQKYRALLQIRVDLEPLTLSAEFLRVDILLAKENSSLIDLPALVRQLLDQRSFNVAKALLESALTAKNASLLQPFLGLQLAAILEVQGDLTKAVELAKKSLAIGTPVALEIIQSARLALRAADFAWISELAQKYQPNFFKEVAHFQEWVAIQAEAHVLQGESHAALKLLETYVDEQPSALPLAVQLSRFNAEALAHYYLERYENAAAILNLALKLGAEDPLTHERITSLNRLGMVESRMGRFEAAFNHLREGIKTAADLFDLRQRRNLENNLATLLQDRGDLGGAFAAYEDAFRSAYRLGDVTNQTIVRLNQVNLYRFIGDYKKALQHLGELSPWIVPHPKSYLFMVHQALLGQIYLRQGRPIEARKPSVTALRLAKSLRRHLEIPFYQLQLAAIYKASRPSRSRYYLRQIGENAPALALAESCLLQAELSEPQRRKRPLAKSLEHIDHDPSIFCRDLAWRVHALLSQQVKEKEHQDHHWRKARTVLAGVLANLPEDLRLTYESAAERFKLIQLIEEKCRMTELPPIPSHITAEGSSWILEVAQRLNQTLEKEAILDLILEVLLKTTGAKRGHLLIKEQEDEALKLYAHLNPTESQAIISQSIAKQVMREGRHFFSANPLADRRLKELRTTTALKPLPLLCLPLDLQRKTIGVVYLEEPSYEQEPAGDLLNLLLTLGNQAATAIQNSWQHEKLLRRNREVLRLNQQLQKNLEIKENEIAAQESRLRQQERMLESLKSRDNLVTHNREMFGILELIKNVAASESSILILGETGTGKELIARRIHEQSPRRNKPFLTVNCAAFSEKLLESELFGHESGAFTGANRTHHGLFEAANGGTLFLDELGDMPLSMQTKLLRVLESGEFRRVGANHNLQTNVRLVAATHLTLEDRVKRGEFRQDLFFRINTIIVHLPALRDRKDDIPHLVDYFISRSIRPKTLVSPEALRLLTQYRWPGNIRELRNEIERAVLFADRLILPKHLSGHVVAENQTKSFSPHVLVEECLKRGLSFKQIMNNLEATVLEAILELQPNGRGEIAKQLKISRKTLYNKLAKKQR